MSERRFYISVLVMVAIFLAGISPACAFISGGSSFIEICAADGSLETVEVDAALDPFAESVPVSGEHMDAMEKCPFCFASGTYKYGEARSQVIAMLALPRYLVVSSGTAIPFGSDMRVYQPRGPPVLS